MRIVEVIKGENKGKFLIQKPSKKGWITVKECNTKLEAELEYRSITCPFKDNFRIVDDITFAVRFKNFLENIQVCDASSEEELEYLQYVANKLLQYQIDTVTPNSSEENYLKNRKV